jgi:hypothetical protein
VAGYRNGAQLVILITTNIIDTYCHHCCALAKNLENLYRSNDCQWVADPHSTTINKTVAESNVRQTTCMQLVTTESRVTDFVSTGMPPRNNGIATMDYTSTLNSNGLHTAEAGCQCYRECSTSQIY